MNKSYDVIVIGGGAAGMMCAWQAGLRGKRVAVLERSKKIGRKILMSGGGRCNFTNLDIEPSHFVCTNPHFVKSALKQYTAWDFIGSVIEHDIAYHERDHGQLFCDDKAKDIVEMLVKECESASVDLVMRCQIDSVVAIESNSNAELRSESSHKQTNSSGRSNNRDNSRYKITSDKGIFEAASVVVATGGLSIPHMDPTPFGYEIAREFGLDVLPVRASLVPYTFSGALKEMFARLSGNAIAAEIVSGAQSFREAMLFTHRGLSGPVVLQISNYWQPSDAINIDLLPDANVGEALLEAKQTQPKSLARTVLARWLPKNVVLEFEQLWWPDRAQTVLADWPNTIVESLGQQFNRWEIVPAGTEGYRTAEVTIGGVDTDALSSKTMEVKNQPGLYFIGEVVDVTGHLGGFNFQWAWSSAYACAQSV